MGLPKINEMGTPAARLALIGISADEQQFFKAV